MFCPNCGKVIEENVAFCPECGGKINTVPTANTMNRSSQQTATTEQVSSNYTESAATVVGSTETGLTALANNKSIRICVAVVLLACVLFMPFFSIMGMYSINCFDMITTFFDGFDKLAGSMDMSGVPDDAVIGIYAFLAGMVIFLIAAVFVLIGAIKNGKSMEKNFALFGFIAGIILFVGLYLVIEAAKSEVMKHMGGMDYSQQMGVNGIMGMISPFKLLGSGFWGGMILFLVVYILNKKRTDA